MNACFASDHRAADRPRATARYFAQAYFSGGFSQGGVIALQTGLRYPVPLAGLLALSTYLGLADNLQQEASAAAKQTPVLMLHGCNDPIVPYGLGVTSRDKLLKFGCQLEWHEYAMEHSLCPQEIIDIENWLNQPIESTRDKR